MSDQERAKYMKDLRAYTEELKGDSHARRELLADAGIVDRTTGSLTEEYRTPKTIPTHR
jgi:hypothetical protein